MKVRFGEVRFDDEAAAAIEARTSGSSFRKGVRASEAPSRAPAQRRSRRRELQEHLWPDTFVSGGKPANPLVTEIAGRDQGTTQRQPRFVRTLHGFGCAFNGEVTDESALTNVVARPLLAQWSEMGRIHRSSQTVRISWGAARTHPLCSADSLPRCRRGITRASASARMLPSSRIWSYSKNGTLCWRHCW